MYLPSGHPHAFPHSPSVQSHSFPTCVPIFFQYYAMPSEVAIIEFLHSFGLSVSQVYGYSSISDNAMKTDYIFIEFIKGIKLSNI